MVGLVFPAGICGGALVLIGAVPCRSLHLFRIFLLNSHLEGNKKVEPCILLMLKYSYMYVTEKYFPMTFSSIFAAFLSRKTLN